MKITWNDSASIKVQCPTCKQPVQITVRELRAQVDVRCARPGCNTTFATRGFVDLMERAL